MDLLAQVEQAQKVVELEQVEILVVLELQAQLTEAVVAVEHQQMDLAELVDQELLLLDTNFSS
tara:strand:+ start:377 stop:565 length:189 start_codon:yes stop_codon:yes gene_type:complete